MRPVIAETGNTRRPREKYCIYLSTYRCALRSLAEPRRNLASRWRNIIKKGMQDRSEWYTGACM